MILKSKQIKGKGRGVGLGFPTINLVIPENLSLEPGIYAAWVVISHTTYKGALHYGPVPTFNEKENSMEVYLLDIANETVPPTQNIEIELDIVEYIRPIQNFADQEDLIHQIADDVEKIRRILE